MSEPSSGWASPGGWTAPAPTPPPPATDFAAPPGWGGPQQAPYAGWGAPRPPELRPGVVPLRPLALGELLDGAVGVIRRYPRPCLGLSAGIAVLTTVIHVVLALTALRPLLDYDTTSLESGNSDQIDGFLGGVAIGGGGGAIISALATLVLTGVLTAVVGKAVLGQPMSLGQAWAQVRPALWRLLGIAVLTALAVYGSLALGIALLAVLVALAGPGTLLLGVPLLLLLVTLAVYLYVRLSLAPAVTVLERAGVVQSLRRSGVLVRRSWWRVCGVLLLTVVIAAFVSNVLQIPFVLFGAGASGIGRLASPDGQTTRVLVLTYIGAGVAQTLVAPFTAGVRALLYVDRRMRAEALDVSLAAAAADRSPTSA